jgi:nitroreductase
MDLFETIKKRRTVRSFTGDPIPRQDLEKIVDAGRLACSGRNMQPWDFIVITQKETIAYFEQHTDWIAKAGAVIAVVVDPSSTRWWLEDGAAASENILLAATALGISGCWLEGVTLEREADYKVLLGIPVRKRLFTLIPLGIPTEIPPKDKKPLEQVLHWERF